MNNEQRSTTGSDGIVIAGGGLAAQRCAEALRRAGYGGPVRMVCSEPVRPYDRPPLSKELLAGERREDLIAYRPPDWYSANAVDLLLGVAATGLAPRSRRLALSDGRTLRYDKLLIATGGRPRTLPILTGYDNVSTLRTVDDALGLRGALRPGSRLAVVGAGFIGLEVAATARRLGVDVTIVEAAAQPLAAVLGTKIGRWFADLHRAEGVEVLTGRTVEHAHGNGSVTALTLSDQRVLETDHVIVGVGVEPDTSWLADSGLETGAGIPVDEHGRSQAPRVFAAGDVAATFQPACGCHVPGSHWEAAARQGTRAARLMLDLDPGPAPLTSFWTDQFGLRIQYLGHSRLADSVEIDGDPTSRSFSALFSRAGRVVAALLVDRPRALPAARNLIEKGRP